MQRAKLIEGKQRPVYADHVRFDVIGNRDRETLDSFGVVLYLNIHIDERVELTVQFYFIPDSFCCRSPECCCDFKLKSRQSEIVDGENCAYLDPHCVAIFNEISIKERKEKFSGIVQLLAHPRQHVTTQ